MPSRHFPLSRDKPEGSNLAETSAENMSSFYEVIDGSTTNPTTKIISGT
jgi:hypothetical protein